MAGRGANDSSRVMRYRTCLRNTILEACRLRPNWKETESDTDWDICWADVPWMREHFDSLQLDVHQRINHFRNHYELTRKDLMVKNLKRAKKQLEREDRASEAANYDFFPVTFILPNEYQMFVEEFKRHNVTWIAKPIGKAQGRGIFLFNDLRDVKSWKQAHDQRGGVNRDKDKPEIDVEVYVAQKYIENPYLVGGKKFDLRLYALVTSYSPLTIWFYRSGFARFSGHRFSMNKGGLGSLAVHLTNVAVQKTETGYDKDAGCKWDLRQLKIYMTSRHGGEEVNRCFYNIQMIVIRSLLAVQKVMMNDKHCFELYGYDVMIDQELKPWLIEVNASPSLSADTQADHDLKVGLLEDMLDVIDMEKRNVPNQEQIGGFDLIYQGGPVKRERPVGVPTFLGCFNNRQRVRQRQAMAKRAREKSAAPSPSPAKK